MDLKRIALIAAHPVQDPGSPKFGMPNFGVYKVEADLRGMAELQGTEIRVFEAHDRDVAIMAEALIDFRPDVVGVSGYLWSMTFLLECLVAMKKSHRPKLTVAGGPSARPELFNQAAYQELGSVVDVLNVHSTGAPLGDLLCLDDVSNESLASIPGLALPSPTGWQVTSGAVPKRTMGDFPSPYQQRLIPPTDVGILQTYFGCPLDCAYCAWGALGDPKDVLSVDYLRAELQAFKDQGLKGALLVDAALNLNAHAFRNLAAAERDVGFFRDATLLCELYPHRMTDDHWRFLSSIARPHISVGLQSFSPEVLASMKRPMKVEQFEEVVRKLAEVAQVTVEIIMGLPDDTPDSFRETLERLEALPVSMRAYHCVVLPDALMKQGFADFTMQWDPFSLKMRACRGWPAGAIDDMVSELNELVGKKGGSIGEFWWSFDGVLGGDDSDWIRFGEPGLQHALSEMVQRHGPTDWRTGQLEHRRGVLRLSVDTLDGKFEIHIRSIQGASRYFKAVGDLAFSYSMNGNGQLSVRDFEAFQALITPLATLMERSESALNSL